MRAAPALSILCFVLAAAVGSAHAFGGQAALPNVNASALFDGKTGGTFGEKTVNILPRSNRVVIGGFTVTFVTGNEVRIVSHGSALRGTDDAISKTSVTLTGVSDTTLQALTDRAYAMFVAQLQAAGREVVPIEQVAPYWASFRRRASPLTGSENGITYRTFAPKGIPIFNTSGTDSIGNLRNMAQIEAGFAGAIVIFPDIWVDFAQMEASRRSGYRSQQANTSARLAMSVTQVRGPVARATSDRVMGMGVKGDNGFIAMTQPVVSQADFAVMRETAASDNRATRTMSGLLGVGLAARGMSANVATTTNQAYAGAAAGVLDEATGRFAKLFAEHPAGGR